jgi:outer membrane protein TolC
MQWNMRGYDAQRIRAGYLPSLSAFGGYSFNAQRNQFDIFDFNQKWFNIAYWGLELQVPIFDSYKKGSIYQQKKLEQQKIQNQMEDFKQSSNLQAAQARTDYKTAKDEFENQKKNLELAQKIYDKVKIKYEEGVGSSIELAQAETELTRTQTSYINSMYDVLSKRSELMKVLGNY